MRLKSKYTDENTTERTGKERIEDEILRTMTKKIQKDSDFVQKGYVKQ